MLNYNILKQERRLFRI